jgi:hypothetical protein
VTTALVVSPENDHSLASLSLDTMVVGHDGAPESDSGMFEMTPPVRSVPPLHGDVRPERRTVGLVARWVPDPRGESGLICSWVPQTGTKASVSFDA